MLIQVKWRYLMKNFTWKHWFAWMIVVFASIAAFAFIVVDSEPEEVNFHGHVHGQNSQSDAVRVVGARKCVGINGAPGRSD